MRRRRVVVLGLAVVVLASAGGWVAGQRIQSPSDIAAKTAPPAASLISAPVEKLVLTSDVVVRGTVRYGSPLAVSLPKSALKVGSNIVTTAPTKGAPVTEGKPVLAMSGRPVLALQGDQPAYRDLGPGSEGADVRQLEDALARLGFDPGPKDSRYDRSTSLAVAAWYQSTGWTPFLPTNEQVAASRTADTDLLAARLERLTASETLATARANLAADTRSASAQEAVGFAQQRVNVTSDREAKLALTALELSKKLDVQVPANEILFFPRLPLRVDDVTVKVGDEPTGALMTVSNSDLTVDAALGVNDAQLVRKGAAARIEQTELSVRIPGTVNDVAGAPGTQGAGPGRFYLQVTPTGAPPSLAGASVVVTITVSSTMGEVLAVPVAALSVGANGATRVQVQSGARASHVVTVTPGLAAKGLVSVTPVAGRLIPGDLVVIGRGSGPSGPGSTVRYVTPTTAHP